MAAGVLVQEGYASEQFCERMKGEIPLFLEDSEYRVRLGAGESENHTHTRIHIRTNTCMYIYIHRLSYTHIHTYEHIHTVAYHSHSGEQLLSYMYIHT